MLSRIDEPRPAGKDFFDDGGKLHFDLGVYFPHQAYVIEGRRPDSDKAAERLDRAPCTLLPLFIVFDDAEFSDKFLRGHGLPY
jgi:hypothetical protein